jgi:hypothetical protein
MDQDRFDPTITLQEKKVGRWNTTKTKRKGERSEEKKKEGDFKISTPPCSQ